MSALDQIREVYFGGADMPPPLDHESRRKVILVSLAPGIVLAAAVIHAALTFAFDNSALYGLKDGSGVIFGYPDQVPLAVRRLYAACEGFQVLQPLALALLFASGLQRWSRAEGSWMRVIGVSLAAVAFASGAFVVGTYAVLSREDGVQDLEIFTWMSLATAFGTMSIGYFFLAYRGTSAPE